MRSIRIIQIGDIHYPDAVDRVQADLKDPGFNQQLARAISPTPLQTVLRELARIVDEDKCSMLAFCGDLTSRGQLEAYKDCVAYLIDSLQLTDSDKWPQDQLHVVPGNHDVDRDLAKSTDDLSQKFEPLEEAWSRQGLPLLATSTARETIVDLNGCQLAGYSVNSCVGCGESRRYPSGVHDAMQSAISEHNESNATKLNFEQLDTPAFDNSNLGNIVDAVRNLSSSTCPFVLAHHNLLPQATPRVEVYTELINSGFARTRFSTLSVPLVYLHGHIHDDPIELIQSPDYPDSLLICISAPLFENGFNVIDVQFGHSKEPLGCSVTRYAMERHAGLTAKPPSHIRFPATQHRNDRLHPTAESVMPVLDCTYRRFGKIAEATRELSAKHTRDQTIADILVECYWRGIVDITDMDKSPRFWQIRRKYQ